MAGERIVLFAEEGTDQGEQSVETATHVGGLGGDEHASRRR